MWVKSVCLPLGMFIRLTLNTHGNNRILAPWQKWFHSQWYGMNYTLFNAALVRTLISHTIKPLIVSMMRKYSDRGWDWEGKNKVLRNSVYNLPPLPPLPLSLTHYMNHFIHILWKDEIQPEVNRKGYKISRNHSTTVCACCLALWVVSIYISLHFQCFYYLFMY